MWAPFAAMQVLRFNAYFTERIEGCALENWRVRRCHLLLYLEDSSLQVCSTKAVMAMCLTDHST
jgi:hypothetical protein